MSKDSFMSPRYQYNCPNCAAPLTGESICRYCGTRIEWIPVVAQTVTVFPKRIVPIQAEFRLDKRGYNSVESEKFCLDSLKREISSYAIKFVKVKKDIDPVLNTFVYRGELLVCEPEEGGDAQ